MAQTLLSTPRADGFFMPAEWSAHAGTWMLWPQRPDNWRLGGKPAQQAFCAVASAIARFEPVTVGANIDQYHNARSMLAETGQAAQIRVVELANNDAWMRDCGPTFVVNGQGKLRGVDWRFNAWGGLVDGLYFPWDLDEAVAEKVLEVERIERYKAGLVLEGGSIHVDGEGTCLTTAECLLSPGRNPELSRLQIEQQLCEMLNVEKVLWIPRGVFNDETNGHIDNLACFVRPGEIALTWTEDRSDPQYERSAEALDTLLSETDAKGRPLQVHKIHQPDPILIRPDEAEGVDAVEGPLQPAGTLPHSPGRWHPSPRDLTGRRQHSLHHPTATSRVIILFTILAYQKDQDGRSAQNRSIYALGGELEFFRDRQSDAPQPAHRQPSH